VFGTRDTQSDEIKTSVTMRRRLSEKSASGEHLVFQTRNATPFSDTNRSINI
jgi:hypothetical protein